MKKNNRFLIICVGILGLGILTTGVGYAMGGRVNGIGLGLNGIQVNTPNIRDEGDNFIHYDEKTEEYAKFDSIDATMQYGDVYLIPSDHYGIEYCVDERYGFAPEVVNGCLVAKEKANVNTGGTFIIWGIGDVNNTNIGTKDEYINIYFPADVKLTSVNVRNDFGSVTCDEIQTTQLSVEAVFGDADFSNITGSNAKIVLSSGTLELENFVGETLEISNDFGNVEVQNIECKKRMGITMSNGSVEGKKMQAEELFVSNDFGETILGEVSIAGKSEIESQNGNVTLKKFETDELIVQNDFGDVTGEQIVSLDNTLILSNGACVMDWEQVSQVEVNAEFGNVELILPEKISTYNLDLETEFGDVTVNQMKEGEEYHMSGDGKGHIAVTSSNGDICVKGAK